MWPLPRTAPDPGSSERLRRQDGGYAGVERARERANVFWMALCSFWAVVGRTTASMGWGRPSPTRCEYIRVRSPPASEASRRSAKTSPNPCPHGAPLREAPRMCQVSPPPRTKGWAYRHEPGRGFSGRLEARMPEASLQGGTCGVPLKPLPGSCTAFPPIPATFHTTWKGYMLPSFSTTRMRASPRGWATCSQPVSAKKISPARSVATCSSRFSR